MFISPKYFMLQYEIYGCKKKKKRPPEAQYIVITLAYDQCLCLIHQAMSRTPRDAAQRTAKQTLNLY